MFRIDYLKSRHNDVTAGDFKVFPDRESAVAFKEELIELGEALDCDTRLTEVAQ